MAKNEQNLKSARRICPHDPGQNFGQSVDATDCARQRRNSAPRFRLRASRLKPPVSCRGRASLACAFASILSRIASKPMNVSVMPAAIAGDMRSFECVRMKL